MFRKDINSRRNALINYCQRMKSDVVAPKLRSGREGSELRRRSATTRIRTHACKTREREGKGAGREDEEGKGETERKREKERTKEREP